MKQLPAILFACGTLCFAAPDSPTEKQPPADAGAPPHGTITEKTPSIPQYFTWINNTNEGATAEQTLINLRFFKWLHDEFGMRLGIYAFDAGAIDSQQYYGRMDSERFRRQFPDGFKEIAELAKSFDCRLGLWGGPDGFGDTPEEEAARTEMLVSLCRDYGFQLFKFDSVCGQLRDEKQQAFMNAMAGCRQHAPDLVVLNHRLKLTEDAKRHVTTYLWEGAETYIDVHMINRGTATHNRAGALERGLPPGLGRLTEDCGVCLSSCLDFWEDDLVLQAFNRSLILAPELYGNPWLLRDDEFPKMARLFNLHFRNREILVEGMALPASYGKHAVARGDGDTRFITLRNLGWNPIKIDLRLDGEIGLTSKGRVELRQYHPSEQMLGSFEYGDSVSITVDPFRACLLMATVKPSEEIGVTGCRYEIVRDTPQKVPVADITKDGGQHELHDHHLHVWEAKVPAGMACRYLRLAPAPDRTAEVELWKQGERLEVPASSRATVLFAPYDKARAELAWQAKISLPAQPAPNSHLCVALNGEHGKNGAYAALRIDGKWIGAPQRAASYPAVAFEFPPRSSSSNYTYFFPITEEMHGRNIEVVVLGLKGCAPALKPEVWTTTYPHPYGSLEIVIE